MAVDRRGDIAFVLVRPQHPGNIGACARVLANFGLGRLVLVQPEHDPLQDPRTPVGVYRGPAWAMACGAEHVLRDARRAETLDEALADAVLVLGTTRRMGEDRRTSLSPRDAARMLLAEAPGQEKAVLFGPEATGLTTADLAPSSHIVTIPTDPGCPSMNLAQAVAVMAYEVSVACGDAVAEGPSRALATTAELDGMVGHLRSLLGRVGFLNPQNPDDIMRSLRRIFARARLDEREVRILRGVCRQVDWALDHPAAAGRKPTESPEPERPRPTPMGAEGEERSTS